jgi:hypothetical protein
MLPASMLQRLVRSALNALAPTPTGVQSYTLKPRGDPGREGDASEPAVSPRRLVAFATLAAAPAAGADDSCPGGGALWCAAPCSLHPCSLAAFRLNNVLINIEISFLSQWMEQELCATVCVRLPSLLALARACTLLAAGGCWLVSDDW